MLRRILLTFLLPGLCTAAVACRAQDAPDLLGTWIFESSAPARDERCGERTVAGQIEVSKRITARAWRGSARVQETSARCRNVVVDESDFTLRLRDEQVTIEYDKEGWSETTLKFDGTTMTGTAPQGAEATLVRAATTDPTSAEIDYEQLDEFLAGMAPDLKKEMRLEFGRRMLLNLEKTGLTTEEAEQVADQTLDRMTSCVLDMVRDKVIAQAATPGGAGRAAYVAISPKNIDYRKMDCIYAAAQNAGVVIR
jgi:hypothetical protein